MAAKSVAAAQHDRSTAGFLDALRKTAANSPQDVGAAIESYYEQMLRA